MRRLGLLIGFLGLLELTSTAPDREKRQVSPEVLAGCREIFHTRCDTLSKALSCQCVPYYRCSVNSTNTDGEFIINPRIGSSPCQESLDVCCPPASILPDTNNGGPTTTVNTGCGYRNSHGVGVRIMGSNNEAQVGEFPWMMAVLQKSVSSAGKKEYLCGGSLIHPRAVLTSAHNIKNKLPADLVIRGGEWDTQTRSELNPYQEREVEAIIMHENFNTRNHHNDFAILILKSAFVLAPHVNVICLPEESDIFDAASCTATGWGKDKFEESGKFQAILKKVELPVVPHVPCQTALRLTSLKSAFILDPSFICAGGEPELDTCTGDGGSPLVCPLTNSPNRYVQAGIVSWGIGCGGDRVPGVYSNVAKARRWIDRKMALYNLDTRSYVPITLK